MSYTSPDFADSVVNRLYQKGLISKKLYDSGDLAKQAAATIRIIDRLADDSHQAPVEVAAQPVPLLPPQSITPATRFMAELLDANETLTDIGERYGLPTLADCMYLLSAIQKGTTIEVHHPTMSEILDVVQALPSASEWMRYVHQVAT